MLDYLGEDADVRKLRLLICAYGRALRPTRYGEFTRQREAAIAVAERFADGQASAEELGSLSANNWVVGTVDAFLGACLCMRARELKASVRAGLLRCIFGNPFRPVVLKPAWLTADVVNLARAAYSERLMPQGELDGTRLGVLADALEEAACCERAVLDHLRGRGPHVRGCFAVDLCVAAQ
jgi:hypothetical protein